MNIKYKKGSTNNVAYYLSRPLIVVLTTVLNSCGHKNSDWLLLYKSDPDSATHTRRSWRETKFQNFTSGMYYCVTWDTFVFLQASVTRLFEKRTIVKSLGISRSRKQWEYCRSISIG